MKRDVTVVMEAQIVAVPPEEVRVWRRGIARMYDELEKMSEMEDRTVDGVCHTPLQNH